jgi:GNAT superfamily N-acetyltransferase
VTQLRIRLLTPEDLPFADSLRRAEGWNQTLADWERLLAHQPDGCFLATWNDRPAGVVTTTVHDGRLGWIGMMLVASEFRRKGIATALIERCLDYLIQLGVTCIKLDATPAGQPVYERLGFQFEWAWQRRERPSEIVPDVSVGGDEWVHYDRDPEAFGANRQKWLARVARGARVICRERGYGMLRPGTNAGYLGPIASPDAATAEAIVRELLENVDGRVIWDLPNQNPSGTQLAESLEFRPIRDLVRMWTGHQLIAGYPEWQYGFADPGTG